MILAVITDILPQVTSPLALAALVLLAGGGVLRVLARGRNRAGLQTALRWVFGTAIVLGVFANIAFVSSTRFNSETRIAGKVRDAGGAPLARVVVELVGTGARGMTGDDGDFSFTLPVSRQAPSYELQASLPGYTPEIQTLTGPQPPQRLSLTLVRPELKPESILLTPGMTQIMHQMGLPFIDLSLTIANPLPWSVEYKRLKISLRNAAETEERTMEGFGSFIPGTNQYSPVFLAQGRIEPGSEYALTQRYVSWSERPDELMGKAISEAQKTFVASTGAVTLSADLVKELAAFCDRVWFWSPGEWIVDVSLLFDGRPVQRSFRFRLSEAQVKRMREVTSRYSGGFGVLPDRPFPPEAIVKVDPRPLP